MLYDDIGFLVLYFSLAALLYLIMVRRYPPSTAFLSSPILTEGFLVPLDAPGLVFVSMIQSLSFLETPDFNPCCSSHLAFIPMAQRTFPSIAGVIQSAK